MKRYLQIVLVAAMLLVGFSDFAMAQTAISAEKRKLISELIVLTKVDKQIYQVTDTILASLEQMYPQIAQETIGKTAGLTDADRVELQNVMISRQQSFSRKFREQIPTAIDYQRYIEVSVYPLYNKFFSESELRDLVAFYKTPTGQKVIETMPALFAESMQITQAELTPQLIKLTQKILAEELETAKRPTPKRITN